MAKFTPHTPGFTMPIYENGKREQDLRSWSLVSSERKQLLAHNISTEQGRNNRGDVFLQATVYNHLMQGIETPTDYGLSNWRPST